MKKHINDKVFSRLLLYTKTVTIAVIYFLTPMMIEHFRLRMFFSHLKVSLVKPNNISK